VIVHEFYIGGTIDRPNKAYTPLVIHANGPRVLPIPSQSLQPVGRRHSKVVDQLGGVQQEQLVPGAFEKAGIKASNAEAREHIPCSPVLEPFDHDAPVGDLGRKMP
jgi:hypothetical protein